ncbi:hypothetical protein [Thermoflexus sp.]|uniref:hypothetical protein n=1 Tax=Thermoflexus sp. TaxID=1969742 RepID=UPI002ADE9034|nr:hypothetical protein [Thermoflexus sp.]
MAIRRAVVAVLAVLALGAAAWLPPRVAYTQGPVGQWTAWPFLQNLENQDAQCLVSFYREDATTPDPVFTVSVTVPANGSRFIPVYSYDQLGVFSGSMVVSCDRRVVAVTNVVNQGGAGSSYTGFEAGATEWAVPSVHANDWGWFTEISVQNAGSSPVMAYIAFRASVRGQDYSPPPVTIQPGSVHRFDTSKFANQLDNIPGIDGFVGSAVVTSTGPVAVVVREWKTGEEAMTIAYNAIPAGEGGTEVFFPSQHNNNYGWHAWNYVFNSLNTPVDVQVQFTNKPAVTRQIPARGSLLIDTLTYLGNEDYIGALTVKCISCPAGTRPLSGISNEVQIDPRFGRGALSYNAFYTGTTSVFFPSQHNKNYGWNAFNFIQNLSSFDANVRVEWVADPASPSPAPPPFNVTIPANGQLQLHTYIHLGTQDFIGSLRVTSLNGARIVGICNENNERVPNLDATISYNGISQ